MAREQEIPFVFALGRKALGRCVNKLVPVSVVGIFNYFGAEVSLRRHSPSVASATTPIGHFLRIHASVVFENLQK